MRFWGHNARGARRHLLVVFLSSFSAVISFINPVSSDFAVLGNEGSQVLADGSSIGFSKEEDLFQEQGIMRAYDRSSI